MRLKAFTAPTLSEAMQQVRVELGPEAVIIDTQDDGALGTRILAAVEALSPREDQRIAAAAAAPAPTNTAKPTTTQPARPGAPRPWRPPAINRPISSVPRNAVDPLIDALTFHGVPVSLRQVLATADDVATPESALSANLARDFKFASLAQRGTKPLMLVGPPGVGKTLGAAKLATQSVIGRRPVRVITADHRRAAAFEQLSAFTRILGIELESVENAQHLSRHLAENPAAPGTQLIIDTPAANPLSSEDLRELSGLVTAARAEPVLVLAAGGNAEETAESAAAFAALGCTRLVVTRLDTTRRYGSILAAAHGARLAFADVSSTASVAHGLEPIDAPTLARLLLTKRPAPPVDAWAPGPKS
jgi:flagellar biosynthesis protein FlhF